MVSNRPRKPNAINRDGPRRKHRPDYWLIILASALLVIGLVVVYSISPGLAAQNKVTENYYSSKQAISILMGIIAFVLASMVPTNKWSKFEKPLIGLSIVAAIIVILFGEKINGAYRWIQIGGFSFQAVELIKFTIIIWLAGFLTARIKGGELADDKKTTRPILILLGVIACVVANPFLQSDLGSTGVIVAVIAAMCFVATLPMKRIATIALIIFAGTFILVISSPYRMQRFQTYLQPESDCQNSGYQACQALIAVGSGGIAGKGLAHSVQAYGYLPEAANDSIFAIYAEKFGFLGVSIILVLFAGLFTRLKNIMERAPDIYSRLIVTGVLAWISTQAIINIGAMIGLLPLKGITLPFISYGGTSIIFVMALIGVVFNISRYTTYSANTSLESEGIAAVEDNTNRRRDRRTYYATSGRRA